MARFYRLVRLVIDLLALRGRTNRSKGAEILVCTVKCRDPASNPSIERS